jgi:hypothetical protein
LGVRAEKLDKLEQAHFLCASWVLAPSRIGFRSHSCTVLRGRAQPFVCSGVFLHKTRSFLFFSLFSCRAPRSSDATFPSDSRLRQALNSARFVISRAPLARTHPDTHTRTLHTRTHTLAARASAVCAKKSSHF